MKIFKCCQLFAAPFELKKNNTFNFVISLVLPHRHSKQNGKLLYLTFTI